MLDSVLPRSDARPPRHNSAGRELTQPILALSRTRRETGCADRGGGLSRGREPEGALDLYLVVVNRGGRGGILCMRFEGFSFGSIRINGVSYDHDVVIARGEVRRRKKKPSKKFRDEFGHTPLSIEEKIPWKCRCLVVGTGTGALPVMEAVKREAKCRNVELLIFPTVQAIEILKEKQAG